MASQSTKNIICIVCPRGCKMVVREEADGKISVSGNSCLRGENFAKSEISNPTRSLTTTIKTSFTEMPFLPVRTKGEVPKEALDKVLKTLRNFTQKESVNCGDIIISNVCETGIDIIATDDLHI